MDWRLLVKGHIAYIGIPLDFFVFLLFQRFLSFGKTFFFWSLGTILLCIMGELAWGGSVAVAVGVICDR